MDVSDFGAAAWVSLQRGLSSLESIIQTPYLRKSPHELGTARLE